MELKNSRLEKKAFERVRTDEVLNSWATGKDLTISGGISYQERLPRSKRFSRALDTAMKTGRTLIQPRAGVGLVGEHISLLRRLAEEGGADLLPTTIDSYTRQNRYREAEDALKESRSAARSFLNGFPAVNYGVEGCRKVIESLDRPVEIRHGTPDARLLAEIALASGFTSFEGGGVSYNIPYAKDVPLAKSLLDWQYVDYLCGLYGEEGVVINREPFGPLTATLVPPSIANAVSIIESLLAAEQGVRNITVGCGQGGNLCQDMAALRVLRRKAEDYLGAEDYDVSVSTVFHQWMGGFPLDESRAFAVIAWGAMCGALAGATKIIVKTPQEAMGVPSAEANIKGLKTTSQMVSMLEQQFVADSAELEEEEDLLGRETDCILKKVYELGGGDWAAGTVRAFEAGVLDVPFAPARANPNRVLPARDLEGAIRFLDAGDLPFDAVILRYHEEKLRERAVEEKREVGFHMLTDDIYAVSKGRLVGKPRPDNPGSPTRLEQ